MGISRQQALDCLRSNDLIGIGMEADAVRRQLHPEGVVSYAVECAISMTGGMRAVGKAGEASLDVLYDEIRQTIDHGSTGVRLVGGLGSNSKDSRIEGFVGVVRGIRQRFPSLWLEGLSAADIVALVTDSRLELRETIARLHDAGLDSIASDDAQPKCSPSSCSPAEWIEVHRAAHSLGMRTIAATFLGAGDTLEQRVDTLAAIRQLRFMTATLACQPCVRVRC